MIIFLTILFSCLGKIKATSASYCQITDYYYYTNNKESYIPSGPMGPMILSFDNVDYFAKIVNCSQDVIAKDYRTEKVEYRFLFAPQLGRISTLVRMNGTKEYFMDSQGYMSSFFTVNWDRTNDGVLGVVNQWGRSLARMSYSTMTSLILEDMKNNHLYQSFFSQINLNQINDLYRISENVSKRIDVLSNSTSAVALTRMENSMSNLMDNYIVQNTLTLKNALEFSSIKNKTESRLTDMEAKIETQNGIINKINELNKTVGLSNSLVNYVNETLYNNQKRILIMEDYLAKRETNITYDFKSVKLEMSYINGNISSMIDKINSFEYWKGNITTMLNNLNSSIILIQSPRNSTVNKN